MDFMICTTSSFAISWERHRKDEHGNCVEAALIEAGMKVGDLLQEG